MVILKALSRTWMPTEEGGKNGGQSTETESCEDLLPQTHEEAYKTSWLLPQQPAI